MTLYVFDFDGVLFDTARECLAVAYASTRKIAGATRERWRDLDEPLPSVTQMFLANRHWVGPPWQYAVLLDCIATERMPSTTAEFLALAATRKGELSAFTELYFETRCELARDLARWCSVIDPYAEALAAFARLHAAGHAAILSTRDDRSIQRILGYFAGVEPVLLPRSGPREKWEILVETSAARGLSPSRVFFVDDYAHHALGAHRRGIAAHVALWGYLGPDDIETARANGLPCLALAELDTALARHEEENAS
jgi:phosphoglycolate phosphatase-like HAD superfamily hydrolase